MENVATVIALDYQVLQNCSNQRKRFYVHTTQCKPTGDISHTYKTAGIKLHPRGSTNLRVAVVCNRDFEINPIILKPEDDLDILNKYHPHTENKAANVRHSKLRA